MSHSKLALKYALLTSTSCALAALSTAGHSQTIEIPQPPVNSMTDAHNIDLTSGQLMFDVTPFTIGDTKGGLAHTLFFPGLYGFRHDEMITAVVDDCDLYGCYGYHVTIAQGKESSGFTWNGTTYLPDKGDGSTLSVVTAKWTYTDRNGVVTELDRTPGPSYTSAYNSIGYYGAIDGVASLITRPDGFKTRLTYKTASYAYSGGGISGTIYATRLQSVTNSAGFQLKYGYASNTLSQATANNWVRFAQVTGINNAVDYCDPTADICSGLSPAWPSATYGSTTSGTNTILSITDAASRTRKYTFDNVGRLIAFRRPGSATDTTTYGYYTSSSAISSVAVASIGTWGYTFSLNSSVTPPILSGTVTTPTVATPFSFTANYNIRQPLTLTDENSNTTSLTYDAKGRVQTKVLPGSGSDYTTYGYDTRGNLTSVAKSGSGLGNLTTSATYPADPCANVATCNKPVTTTNSDSQVSNYYYNSNGTPDYVQSPAPATGAARPEVHFYYGTAQARVKDVSGTIVDQGDVVTLPAGSTTCATGAWPCTTANQVVTQSAYYSGPAATNLFLQSQTVKSGTGSPTSTTSLTYDNIGNIISSTDPVSNVTTRSYTNDRQPLLVVGPSVDGLTTSSRRAVQYHYNGDGLNDSATFGAYNPTTQALTTRRVETTTYDSQGRPIVASVTDGTTTSALTQYSYNGANRPDCVAQRMNPAIFGSIASTSACSLGATGSGVNDFGPDQITRSLYDNVGQLLTIQTAYGVVGQQRDLVTYSYSNHGLQETMTDAKGNLTAFAYDGFDRLLRSCYQGTLSACSGATSTDYVQLGYNSAGRLTTRSLRGSPASTIGYTYDKLGRVTNTSFPGGGTFDQPITFTYDNLGRQLSATDASGHSATFAYDALGNVISQGDAISARTMRYDAAGRRTRLSWADGSARYISYEYNGASDLKYIKETVVASGTTTLATFAYDDIGRRQSLTLGNGVVMNYSSYTPLGVGSIALNLPGTANDQTLGFTYSPAGQIKSKSSANDAYAFRQLYNADRDYTANSLNQYTAAGLKVPTYDAKGNLTTLGASTFTYSTKNELTQRTDTGVQFYHDPLGRLDTITAPSGTTKFQYDGVNISTELNGSNVIQRRYVYGPGADEPLVQYDGSDFTAKRYLVADEHGSIIAVTDNAGNPVTINSYDDYGTPASGNLGRFQYTGQAWIGELGMYDYKARIYSPQLGRFLQTDPAGYPDGPNWYAYVGNDPVNNRDPSGLAIDPNDPNTIIVTAGGGSYDGFGGDGGIGAAFAQMQAMMMAQLNAITYSLNLSAAQSAGGRRGPQKTEQKPKPCISSTDGPVDFTGGGLDLVLGVGGGIGFYKFSIPSTGAEGWVASGGFLGGGGGFLGGSKGRVDNFGNFTGFGWRGDFSTPIPAVGGEVIFGDKGNLAGGAASVGAGGGYYGGRTKTRVLSSNIPVCP